MNLSLFNNIKLEYSVGANVVMFSLIDTSINKSVLISSNVTKFGIEYSYNNDTYFQESNLDFHVNSIIMIISGLPAETDITFTPYLVHYNENNIEEYKIQICNSFVETTLQYGNISFDLIPSDNPSIDTEISNKISNVLSYINGLGTYIDNTSFNNYTQYALTIPIKYDSETQTASAYYYRYKITDNNIERYGLVQTSGGQYANNNTFFHELRHRYGIGFGTHLIKDDDASVSNVIRYISNDFSVLHDALRFESGRSDARVMIFDSHSNILEGSYTNDGDKNYLAANYIKALIWYTFHGISDIDTSKIRKEVQKNLSVVFDISDDSGNTGGGDDNGNDNGNTDEPNVIDEEFENIIEEHTLVKAYKKTINIGPYQFLYEYLKNGDNFDDIGNSNQFVILRNFEIINNIIYDKDIFFIEKSIYDRIMNSYETDLLCYPLYKNGSIFFSNTYEFFNNYNISKLSDIHYDIYDEQNDNQNANILCDKLRIYNPTIKNDLDYIIYLDNYINNIHFHYICNKNTNYSKKYCGEIVVNKNRYIEYIEVNVPNIKSLFNKNNKFYIQEDFNKISSTNKDITEYLESNNKNITNKLYLSEIIQPYFIDKKVDGENNNKEIFIKTYLTNKYFNFNNNDINTSVNILLYPYIGIDNNLYIMHDILPMSSTFVEYNNYFRLSSRLGFDNGNIALLNEFLFPGKKKENYNLSDIIGNDEQINYINKFSTQVTDYYNTFFLYENILDVEDHEDYSDELNVENIRSTGYFIQFAIDKDFQDIIWESAINTDNNMNNFIYDFSFSLNNLVDNWNQLNDILIVRTKFIDKRLNNVIYGNNVVITKEWFKYFINDISIPKIIFDKQNNLINNMDTSYFNFIDNINCNIIESNENIGINILNDNQVNTKIIYKPIFYKVQNLQNIRLREGITQNIGINLGEYLNKVDTFILNIDGKNIKESARNDVFVIFSINSNNLENTSGYYNILDSNFEYISSGNYIKY